MSDHHPLTVQHYLNDRAALKPFRNRSLLIESSLSEDLVLPQGPVVTSGGGPEPTQAFSHETIKMMMAVRQEQVEKLRGMIAPAGLVYGLTPRPGSLWANITVGRADEGVVVLSDPAVSTNHAQFELDQPERPLSLTDLGSTNGTYINGQRIQPHEPATIGTGDCIRFGQAIFYVMTVELFGDVLDALTG